MLRVLRVFRVFRVWGLWFRVSGLGFVRLTITNVMVLGALMIV